MNKTETYKKTLRSLINKSKPRSKICKQHNIRSPWAGGGLLHESFDEIIMLAKEALDNLFRGYLTPRQFIKEAEQVLSKYRSTERDVALAIENTYDELEKSPFRIKKEDGKIEIQIPRGGKREGAGSKTSIGITKKVSVTLPEEEWIKINKWIECGKFHSYSEYFRTAHERMVNSPIK
jgi:hypothetical protein